MNPSVSEGAGDVLSPSARPQAHTSATRPIRTSDASSGSRGMRRSRRCIEPGGDRVIGCSGTRTRSALADDRAHGCSTVEVELLNRQYLQLSGTMDRDAWARRGAKRKSRQVGPPVSKPSPSALSPLVDHDRETARKRLMSRAVGTRCRGEAALSAASSKPCRSRCRNRDDGVNDPSAVPSG